MSLSLLFAFIAIAYKHPHGMHLTDFVKEVGLTSPEADRVLQHLGVGAPAGAQPVGRALRLVTVGPDPADPQRLLVTLTRRGIAKLGIKHNPFE